MVKNKMKAEYQERKKKIKERRETRNKNYILSIIFKKI
jgi:hypothetical protein